jgi:hypothetical protein
MLNNVSQGQPKMAHVNTPPSNFADVLTISEAADFLGVSTATLRNWDRSGKLKPRRHPQNGYRIYLHEDLKAVLRSADLSSLADESFAPQVDWSAMKDSDHFVVFYENDRFFVEAAAGFVDAALKGGACAVLAITAEHRAALNNKLASIGIDIAEAEAADRYLALDAREALSRFMVDDSFDRQRFDDFFSETISPRLQAGRPVRAFGEMAPLLIASGNREAAIQLEQTAEELVKQHQFSVLCAYSINGFGSNGAGSGFGDVCSCHSRVIPAESYSAVDSEDKRLRAVTQLQQNSQSRAAKIRNVATLSRELRNRLEPIRSSLESLESSSDDDASGIEARCVIRRQFEQIIQLADN